MNPVCQELPVPETPVVEAKGILVVAEGEVQLWPDVKPGVNCVIIKLNANTEDLVLATRAFIQGVLSVHD
jgi:hypothetical protein